MSKGRVRGLRTALASVVAGLLFVGSAAFAQTAPKFLTEGVVAGYATGTVYHTNAFELDPETRLTNVEVAHAGASVNSQGLGSQQLNELQRIIRPASVGSKAAYAFGHGVEVGVARSPSLDGQVLQAGKAESSAPPTAAAVTKEIAADADPAAYASVARGQAATKWNDDGDVCILGDDISRGIGYVNNAQVADLDLAASEGEGLDNPLLATNASDPDRAWSQTLTRNRLVPQKNAAGEVLGAHFGLMSEVRQTIAPVTILGGDGQTTIEFLGEWVLRVVATGVNGGAYVHYGPGTVNPQTPVLRIIDAANQVTDVLSLQDILEDEGLTVELPGIGELTIGENPRAIGGDTTSVPVVSADGTSVSAAVDVVRVNLLEEVLAGGVQIRIGHMEATAQVPAGGIRCDIPVTKTPDPGAVTSGQTFVTHIDIKNPFDCDLGAVKLVDVVTTPNTAQFPNNKAAFRLAPEIGDISKMSNPNLGANLDSATFTWPDLGAIPRGGTLRVTVPFQAQGGTGLIYDEATATATLINCVGEDDSLAGTAVGVTNTQVMGTAVAGVQVGAVLGARLARTGPTAANAIGLGAMLLGLAVAGVLVRRRYA